MRVLMCNTYGNLGGASKAAVRLMQGLANKGVDISMHVLEGEGENINPPSSVTANMFAKVRRYLERNAEKVVKSSDSDGMFSLPVLSAGMRKVVESHDPDVIHLHWINSGLAGISDVGVLNRPMVWTLHDMWPFTGGCHYSGACEKYTSDCGGCNMLRPSFAPGLARKQVEKKVCSWKSMSSIIVAPSQWMATCAANSSVFKNHDIRVVPNGLDIELYKPISKRLAKELLGLCPDKRYILFGAISAVEDRRKGYQYLEPALRDTLSELDKDIEVVVFGASRPEKPLNIGMPVHYLGHLYDDISLVMAYNAADVMLVPSEQDNLPNTIVEALSCGVPCVAFDVGGMSDLIMHNVTGYLASPFDTEDFAAGIVWVLSKAQATLSSACRQKAEVVYNLRNVSKQYLDLYQELLR